MPSAYKILGQTSPVNTSDTTLYTCPADTQTVISTITVANLAATGATFRIAVRPNGATLENAHYIAYDVAIAANGVVALTLGITIDAADVVTVRASATNLSFNAFGTEITA